MGSNRHKGPGRVRRALSALSALAAVLAVMVALSGCVRADLDARISKEGTVSGVLVLAFSNEVLAYIGQDRASVLREVRAASAAQSNGVRVEIVDDGSYVGERIVFEDIPVEDFGTTVATLARSTGPIGESVAQDFKLEKVGNRWRFFGTIDLAGDKFSISPENGADPEMPKRTFKMSMKLTFPGRILARDRNAKVKGRSITWTAKLGQTMQMQAVAQLA
jgi:small basic protein